MSETSVNSHNPSKQNILPAAGDKHLEFLIAAEKSMNAMQSKFSAVNGLQGEIKNFKQDMIKTIDDLNKTNTHLGAEVKSLKMVVAGLKNDVATVTTQIPASMASVVAETQSNTQHLTVLSNYTGKLSTEITNGLDTNLNLKYILLGGILILATIIGLDLYEKRQQNNYLSDLDQRMEKIEKQLSQNKQANGNDRSVEKPQESGKRGNRNKN